MTNSHRLSTSTKPRAATARGQERRMDPLADHRLADRAREGDALPHAERPDPNAPNPNAANRNTAERRPSGHHHDVYGSPIPGRDDSAGTHEPSGPSPDDPANHDEERFRLELVAELATLEARQAELRRRVGPSTVPNPDFDNGAYRDHSYRAALASSAYAPAGADWLETSMNLHQPDSLFRRVAIPAFFALALPIFAGAVAVFLFAPSTRPAAVIADNAGQSGEAYVSAAASPILVKPTAMPAPDSAPRDIVVAVEAPPPNLVLPDTIIEAEAPPPVLGPRDNIVAAEASPLNSAPPDNITAVAAPIGAIRIPRQGGVTLLQRRNPPPASTASIVAPVQRALVTPAPPIAPVIAPAEAPAEAPADAKVNRAIFAPLDSDAEPPRNAIPREAIALAPTPSIEPRPFAVAPTSDAAAIEPVAKSKPVVSNVATPSQPTQTARANTYVNMRAGPDNTEPVLTVVPAKAPIEVVECNAWCEIIYNGQRGWIYKGFVDRGGAASVSSGG